VVCDAKLREGLAPDLIGGIISALMHWRASHLCNEY
jgi:hypothetical protein